jgi:hypothetical protein
MSLLGELLVSQHRKLKEARALYGTNNVKEMPKFKRPLADQSKVLRRQSNCLNKEKSVLNVLVAG